MVSLQPYLARARASLDGVWWLAVVPFAVALLSAEKFTQLGNADFHVGVSFSFPFPVTGGWAFLSLPDTAAEVGAGGVRTAVNQFGPAAVGFALLSMVATAALTAGYLGTIHRALADEQPQFLADARRYFAPMFGFQLLVLVYVLAALVFTLIFPLFLIVLAVLILAGGYFLYPALHLVVADDRDLLTALVRSYQFTSAGGPALSYAGRYLLATAIISLPATALFVNLGVPGVVGGLAVLAPVGLVFDAATMAFVHDAFDLSPAEGRERFSASDDSTTP
ncbi:hypothetical protein [Halosegnis longus]|uniref:Uncharacterized protein n=1 Tax=Halosegnis longus TaxID=2216012 RepID=A0AAJ4UVM3_9EURY|nr:hypothetical protein [Halosegnis longus]RNJ26167.1 hypothetical protein Nmn1133_05410 [Salella cibi]